MTDSILDTEAFPAQYRELICIGNIHGACLNLDRLQRDGSTYLALAEPDLLTANDAWFMPVSIKVGPDGCLYILDWYDRYHCSQDAARDPHRRLLRRKRRSGRHDPHLVARSQRPRL